jgi:hypothetical protein
MILFSLSHHKCVCVCVCRNIVLLPFLLLVPVGFDVMLLPYVFERWCLVNSVDFDGWPHRRSVGKSQKSNENFQISHKKNLDHEDPSTTKT